MPHLVTFYPRRCRLRAANHTANQAFSLIELVVVVLVMGILAAAAVPRIASSIAYYRIESAAKQIQSDLELARESARYAGNNRTVTFDVSTNSYTLAGVAHPNRPRQTYVVNLSSTDYPVSLVSVALGLAGTSLSVTFDMYGKPDAGGSIVISSAGQQRTVQISGTTAKITIQ